MAVKSFNQWLLWQAAGRHDNLTSRNMEKKARWREEAQKEKEEAAALADKAQWYAHIQTPKAHHSPTSFSNIKCHTPWELWWRWYRFSSAQTFRLVYKIMMWDSVWCLYLYSEKIKYCSTDVYFLYNKVKIYQLILENNLSVSVNIGYFLFFYSD